MTFEWKDVLLATTSPVHPRLPQLLAGQGRPWKYVRKYHLIWIDHVPRVIPFDLIGFRTICTEPCSVPSRPYRSSWWFSQLRCYASFSLGNPITRLIPVLIWILILFSALIVLFVYWFVYFILSFFFLNFGHSCNFEVRKEKKCHLSVRLHYK